MAQVTLKSQHGIISNLRRVLNDMFTELYAGAGTAQYRTYSDGTTTFRTGVRDTYYVIDKTLTATGFSGTEGVDWENAWATQ